jgi:hypothetical protein
MTRTRPTSVVLLCLAVAVVPACVRTIDGIPVAGQAARTTVGSRPPSVKPAPTRQADQSPQGVVPTTRIPVPPNTITCSQPVKPPVGFAVKVDDPNAPRVTVGVPQGWSMTRGSGDVGGKLAGPGGTSATVTIAKTQLDAAAAFTRYAGDAMAKSSVSIISVVPAELCGYSGQKLTGAWSDTPQNALRFVDRIVHVWTSHGDYLVAVHVQAPAGTPGFDDAASVLTKDFEIGIP